jgi:hypothetical protein
MLKASMERTARGRRFRRAFWMVVGLGALPSLVSGALLLRAFSLGALCSETRPTVTPAELRAMVRWEQLHQWGRVGAAVAGLLVLAYATAWAFEARRARGLVTGVAVGLLLPSLAVAMFTGRAMPWRALEPSVWLGSGPAPPLPRAAEEDAGPTWCANNPRGARNLALGYFTHVGAGILAFALTVAMADVGARWREARDRRDEQT